MLAQRRKESCKAASEEQGTATPDPLHQLFRATHSRVGSTNERDTSIRRSSIMVKCRIASTGVMLPCKHLYGDGVSIVPNVCL